MIISRDIHPERDFYFIGAYIIEAIDGLEDKNHDFFEVFIAVKDKIDISINLFMMSLNWLFLMGVVEESSSKDFKKCF